MRTRMVVLLALFVAIALPASASAGGFHGIVIAKEPQRGTLVLAGPGGIGMTIRGMANRARIGDRIALQGTRLQDGTIRASRLSVLSRPRVTVIRGVVLRRLKVMTLVSTGGSVIKIQHRAGRGVASASDDGGLQAGRIAEFRVRIDNDDELEQVAVVPLGQAANVRIEGAIVSVSPFVVSVEGLPVTITVPAGMTLPASLAAGQRIELTVMPAAGNLFTLVSIDEAANEAAPIEQEVEVKGAVVSSTATQLVVSSGGAMFTFAAPTGTTLPILRVGTNVEARGISVNGVLTLERLRLEDRDGGGDSGHGGGGDDGGDGGSH